MTIGLYQIRHMRQYRTYTSWPMNDEAMHVAVDAALCKLIKAKGRCPDACAWPLLGRKRRSKQACQILLLSSLVMQQMPLVEGYAAHYIAFGLQHGTSSHGSSQKAVRVGRRLCWALNLNHHMCPAHLPQATTSSSWLFATKIY